MRIALKIYKCNELNPQGAIKNLKSVNGEPEIIWIEEYDENGKNENAKIDSNERETMVIKPSGYNIMNDIVTTKRRNRGCFISEWKYIPYNFREYNRISCLLKNLKKQFGREIKKNEIENLWKDDVNGAREKIKAAYKRVPGELNTNSMTVFSGTENLNIKQHIDFMNVYFLKKDILIRIKLFEQPSGCLYMGDYAAFGKQKWETLKKAYAEYWEIIGCVQVPHHGSKHNFNEELLGLKCIYVISAGKMNKYGHPHATVLKQFLLKHIIPFIVTEDSDTEVNISVD